MNKSSLPVVPAHIVMPHILLALHFKRRTTCSIWHRIMQRDRGTFTPQDILNALELEITTRPGGVSRVRLVSVEELQKPQAERLWELTPL